MSRRRLAALLVALLPAVGLVAGCAERPTLTDATLPPGRCSADGLTPDPVDNDGLPSAVAATRQALIDAAVACDYRALGRRSVADATDLQFEGEAVPVREWREREDDGIPILAPLVGLLASSPVRLDDGATGFVAWPAAIEWEAADAAPPAERAALEAVVGEGGIFGWTEAGGYSGWRVYLREDGRWARFWYGPVPGEYP